MNRIMYTHYTKAVKLKCRFMLVETMKDEYVNETPPIEVFVNPKMPYIKNVYDVIDSITAQYFSLKNYNDKLKSLLLEHHKAIYNYSRSRLKLGDLIQIAHIVLMDGIIARSLNIFEAILREFNNRNLFSFHCLLRAHIETLCLVYYINKNPDYIKTAVNGMKSSINGSTKHEEFSIISVTTILSHANKKYPKLEENYNILSEYVRPNAISLLTNLNIDLPKKVVLKTHIGEIPEQQALTNIDLFVRWTEYFFEELKILYEKILEIEKKEKESQPIK